MLADLPLCSPLLTGLNPVSTQASSKSAAASSGTVLTQRVLFAACVPGSFDPDHYHSMAAEPAGAASTSAGGPTTSMPAGRKGPACRGVQLTEALQRAWTLLQGTSLAVALGGSAAAATTVPSSSSTPTGQLSAWSSCCQGVDIFTAASTSLATPLGAATFVAPALSPSGSLQAAAAAALPETFVFSIAQGALQPPQPASSSASKGGRPEAAAAASMQLPPSPLQLLAEVIERAASSGLILSGLQTLFLSEPTCRHVSLHSPHRPRPFAAFVALALTGRGGAGSGTGLAAAACTPQVGRHELGLTST